MRGLAMTGKLLKWGNSYGVRITKADVERRGLHVGDPMSVLPGEPGKVDLSHLRVFRGKDRFPGWSHDDVLHLGRLEKLHRSGSLTKSELARERKALEAKYVGG